MERLAIVGSGIAGLGCAHFLQKHYDLTVFEAGEHIGGHSNTRTVQEDGKELPVDSGFMVYNEVTYPLLTRLFAELEVPTRETKMTFSVQHQRSGTEWNGERFSTLFAQRRNFLNLRHWRFLLQLDRFNKEAVAALDEPEWAEMNLAEYVEARGYGQDFLDRYLVPMSSAVWSTPPEKMIKFPAITLLRFWFNHGFLGLSGRHQWRTVDGGSREYVKRLIKPFENRIHTQTPVTGVRRLGQGVEITTQGKDAGTHVFDRVIMAAHADQSLRMLSDPTPLEEELLGPFGYQANDVDLHSDRGFMPKKQLAWASWNYRSDHQGVASIHYWMNNLQGVSKKTDFFVSLNTRDEISPELIREKLQYEHPLFDLPAIAAQKRLPELNEAGPTYFCGSYFRYGFHEDAFKSAVDLSRQILQEDPWG
ncbi:MAG: NAD(P)/FAD-dependent oxidoreductase [Verrucomicrobiales bacterium]